MRCRSGRRSDAYGVQAGEHPPLARAGRLPQFDAPQVDPDSVAVPLTTAHLDQPQSQGAEAVAGYAADVAGSLIDRIWLESRATAICYFQPIMVPGLLQTRDYAETVIRMASSAASEAQIDPTPASVCDG